jgi:hypothetical protein
MQSYTDVLIRIRGASDAAASRFPVEAQIDGSGSWRGESVLEFDKLDPGKQTREEYGIMLGEQLLNPSIARALEQAGVGQGKRVRIRLLVDEEVSAPHWIRWERLYLHIGAAPWPVAISPEIPFSRYIPDERPASDPPEDTLFRLLLAISNPEDLPEAQRIDVESEVGNLLDEFASSVPTARFRVRILAGRTRLSDGLQERLKAAHWDLADGNTTLDNVSKWLHRDGGCHAVHILCHGNFKVGARLGVLFLENEQGATDIVKDFDLQSWIHPKLQLMLFQACRTAALVPEGEPPFAGIAPKMVKFGVPAVIAMQDYVLMSDARRFSAAFYRGLLRDGYVDAAVNEGRQAILTSEDTIDFSIPALFMRLRDGRLWRPDPVRQEVWDTRERIGPLGDLLPLKAVHHVRGLQYDSVRGPEGPLADLGAAASELLEKHWLTCLTGPPGFDKTVQLHAQFQRRAERYLSGEADTAPFLVSLSELAQWGRFRSGTTPGDLRGNMQVVASRHSVPPELAGRRFTFLVEADQDLSDEAEDQAVGTLLRLLNTFSGSHALAIWEESAIPRLRERLAATGLLEDDSLLGDVQVLVVRPMEWPDLRRFLLAQGESALAEAIEERQLSDLASAPWVLARLREFAHLGRFAVSRADAVGLIASSHLMRFDSRRAPRSCAEQALERIAWRIQTERRRSLDNDSLISVLSEVRDRRDFRLGDLLDELFRCQVLAPSGEEAVRFGYAAIQAYFAARYIQNSRRKTQLLEDITATLGRYSRMRQWEHVLIVLAGLQQTLAERIRLLQVMLAGSSLGEGEQGFLAVRMYMEMADFHVDPKTRVLVRQFDRRLMEHQVVRQILDTLIWRSRPDVPRPYSDRRQAVERLAEMRHPDAIRHLVSLAADRFAVPAVATGGGAPPEGRCEPAKRFDNSGIRILAVNGLLLQAEETLDYVKKERSEFTPVLDAWVRMLQQDTGPMVEILNRNDPALSPVAAFALAQAGMEVGGPPLLEVFFRSRNGGTPPDSEVLWAIAEVLSRQDSKWVYEKVVRWWLDTKPKPDRRLCYIIQKLGQAPPDSGILEYLGACLKQEVMAAQDRALRAYSKLNDAPTNRWLIPLCHDIVQGNWDRVLGSGRFGLTTAPQDGAAWRLQMAALEVLRDIGDWTSIAIIRDARLKMDPVLYQLSFQVAEEIYWRLTGGLGREDFAASAAVSD